MGALRLKNPVQRYAWGSVTAIPELLGVDADGAPWAELWMGAHPRAPSKVHLNGATRSLDDVIREQPRRFLGPAHMAAGRLPYLFKVLAAGHPLSIQCHPDERQARVGFDREEAAGIPRGAAHRLYPDPTAKPELVVARSKFIGMKGFRSAAETREALTAFGLTDLIADGGLPEDVATRETFRRLMRSSHDERSAWLRAARRAAATLDRPEAPWIRSLSERFEDDPGALAPLVLNLFALEPGQALFLPARELHAYLHGTALEIMANSDNVLRGGLTHKHVDVDELLRVLDFQPRPPAIIAPQPEPSGWSVFGGLVPQFSLRRGTVTAHTTLARPQPECLEILLCTVGQIRIATTADREPPVALRRGESAAIAADAGGYRVEGIGEAYLASIG